MKNILIADDVPGHLDLFEAILQRCHCRLIRASDGTTALRLAREENPDLIYLDEEMPGLKGTEICRILKAEPNCPPIILVSAHDYDELARRCGADLFLRKPVDEPVLLGTIETMLNMPAREEKRVAVRWPISFWREGSSHTGEMLDVSRTGFFIHSTTSQAVGSRLAIAFPLPMPSTDADGRMFVGEAIVVRCEQGERPGIGCRFFRTTQNGRAALDRFLDAAEPAPAG